MDFYAPNNSKVKTAQNYTYDAEGNLTAVDGGSTASYVYNALNQRVSETVGGTTTQFAYNVAGQRLSIWNTASPAGELQEEYYVGSQRVAYFANNMLHFQHQDWTGTERMRTTFNGAVEGTFTSMSFGDAFATVSGSDGDPAHYAMLDHDYSSDTDHAQFRQYSSTPGRWMSPDPYDGSYNQFDPQSLNRYSYVLNNPVSFTDPLGLLLICYLAPAQSSTTSTDGGPAVPNPIQYWQEECDYYGDGGGGGGGARSGATGGGGGGGGSGTSAPAPINIQQKIAQAKNLLSPHCKGVFSSTIPNYTTANFFNTLNSATINQYPGGTPPQDMDYYGADALTYPSANTIDLLPNFYEENSNTQAFILIHEGIHLFGRGSLGDSTVQNMFGLPVSSNTDNITQYIAGGCHS